MRSCPRYGEPLAQQETGEISSGGLKTSRTRRSLATTIGAIVCLAVAAGAGIMIYQKVPALPSSRDSAATGAGGAGRGCDEDESGSDEG